MTASTTDPTTRSLPRRSASSNYLSLSADIEYLHDSGLTPMTVRFASPDWVLIHSGERLILFGHPTEGQVSVSGGGGDSAAGLGVFFTFTPDRPDQLEALFADNDEVVESTEPRPTIIGGREAVVFDVVIGSRDGVPRPVGPFPWTGFAVGEETMADGSAAQNWMVGCAWNRVWIVDLGAGSLMIHAGDASGTPDAIATLGASETVIQDLVTAIRIGPADA